MLSERARLMSRRRLVVLLLLIVVGLGIIAAVRALREPATATYYACVTKGEVTYIGRNRPTSCSAGTIIVDDDVRVESRAQSMARRFTAQLRRHLSIPDAMIGLSVASLIWIVAGWRIDETRLLLAWVAVPFGAVVAAACVAGPGHWFPKEPYEGPSVIPLGSSDAMTALDLVGLTIALLTVVSAVLLVRHRWRRSLSS